MSKYKIMNSKNKQTEIKAFLSFILEQSKETGLHVSCTIQNPQLWSGFPRPSGRASWFLSDKRLFVGQGHNLLCSLEQRILLWSDCCATLAAYRGP